jgi:hypothetical protein
LVGENVTRANELHNAQKKLEGAIARTFNIPLLEAAHPGRFRWYVDQEDRDAVMIHDTLTDDRRRARL